VDNPTSLFPRGCVDSTGSGRASGWGDTEGELEVPRGGNEEEGAAQASGGCCGNDNKKEGERCCPCSCPGSEGEGNDGDQARRRGEESKYQHQYKYKHYIIISLSLGQDTGEARVGCGEYCVTDTVGCEREQEELKLEGRRRRGRERE
jgi:hypothetical protein